MNKIKLLPEIVANQIKAGEVVESPASAVKEMLENAIDAGATEVTVNFRNGGRDLIQIIDNGCGMSDEDARMAFECHATSKISTLDDIYALHTFGFRGEALASISAVSQVELLTRSSESEIGSRTIINGGVLVSQTPEAAPVGSQFLVRNLFYNTPARRKFIDNNDYKLTSGIKTEFRRVALCHPEVALKLFNNDSPIYNLPIQNLAERIVGTFGQNMKSNILEINVNTSICSVKGYVGRPATARVHGADQYLFVNGRYFHSLYLNKAVQKAYDKLIADAAKPSFFIYISVDASKIDVNVHAKKTEVKFADGPAIWQIINAAVRETLAKNGVVPMIDFDNHCNIEIPIEGQTNMDTSYTPTYASNNNYNPFNTTKVEGGTYSGINDFLPYTTMAEDDQEFEFVDSGQQGGYLNLDNTTPHFEHIALIGRKYASAAIDGRLVVIDLTRARERILYDYYIGMINSGKAVSQQLLFEQTMTLTSEEYELLEEQKDELFSLGFVIDMIGENRISIKGIPADTLADRIDFTMEALLETLSLPQSNETIRKAQLATTMAQSGAYTTTEYSTTDAINIVNQLSTATNINYTSTDKRIIIEITPEYLNTKFE